MLYICEKAVKSTANYTSTLPIPLLEELNAYAQKLELPKNKLIEEALSQYFTSLKRAEFEAGFRRAAQDGGQRELAEEGFTDYLAQLEKYL